MNEINTTKWKDFRERLYEFSQASRERRNQWWFRGQSNFSHDLVPTIDRFDRNFDNDFEREKCIGDLVTEYKREANLLGEKLPVGDAFELLARHHGLPSPLLDWTRSPYVSACFAFLSAGPKNFSDNSVAIFALDLQEIDPKVLDSANKMVELVDDPDIIAFNRRALQQRAVFMRRSTISKPVEELLGDALYKFELPAADRNIALRDLDQMLVNPTTMFYDLEGAARTVASAP